MNLFTLYRLFDASDTLLYIGVSNAGIRRINEHLAYQPWANEIANITLEQHSSREDVELVERQAIKAERPRYNVQHNRLAPASMVAAYSLPVMEGFVTLPELAARLGLQTTGGLRVQIARGRLKAQRAGRDWLVTEEEAERFVKEYTGKPGPKPTKKAD